MSVKAKITEIMKTDVGTSTFMIDKTVDWDHYDSLDKRSMIAKQDGKKIKLSYKVTSNAKGQIIFTISGLANSGSLNGIILSKTSIDPKMVIVGEVPTSFTLSWKSDGTNTPTTEVGIDNPGDKEQSYRMRKMKYDFNKFKEKLSKR